MKRLLLGLAIAGLLSGAVFAQPARPKAFDAADVQIRARGSNPNPQMSGGVLRGGRYDLRNATMVDLITMAYDVDGSRVLGGPNWLELDRFDVIAKAPQDTSLEDLRAMLQGLLADRFKLTLHKDTKPVQGFVLAAGSGKHKLKEATVDTTAFGVCQPISSPNVPGVIPMLEAACRNITMESFVQQLRGMGGAYIAGPISDLTNLKGAWDFDLKWTNRPVLAQAGADGISLFDAVDKQLGLKLESRLLSTPVIVVDAANEKPTENPSGLSQNMPPPPPAEFEVATVKLSEPGAQPNGRIQPGGRIDVSGFTLRQLMTLAWDINDDELLAGAPKWADETRYSIVARASAAALASNTPGTSVNINAPPLDIDDVRLMMRALIIDRFKLKTHVEDRPVTAYVLTAPSPKLAKADPANRTGWKNGVPPVGARDPRDNNPILSRLVTCLNMSMSQLADALPRMAPGYIRTPVVDASGLAGSWDFSFTFTPNGVGGIGGGNAGGGGDGRGPAGAPAAPAASSAADPSGAVSLYDALSKQLGLKLDVQKRPLPVLVIDSVQEKPTED